MKHKKYTTLSWKRYNRLGDFLLIMSSKLDLISMEDVNQTLDMIKIKVEPEASAKEQRIKSMSWLSSNRKYKKYF